MAEFLGFLLVISFIGWGSAFAALHFRRQAKQLDRSVDHDVLARLLEDTDDLATRLSRVEEELSFFRELNSVEDRARLAAPEWLLLRAPPPSSHI